MFLKKTCIYTKKIYTFATLQQQFPLYEIKIKNCKVKTAHVESTSEQFRQVKL